MRLSLMTYTMHPVLNSGKIDMPGLFAFAGANGFDAVEFSFADLYRIDFEMVKDSLDKSGLKTSCINGFFSLAAEDEDSFMQAVAGAVKMVDDAVKLQCPCIMVVPYNGSDICGTEDKPRAAARIVQGLREVVKYAEAFNITVTVEDFPDPLLPLGTVQEIGYMLSNVPGLQLTLDNGNFIPSGDNVMEAYALFKKYIANVHIKDWEYSPDERGILCAGGKRIRGGSHGKGLIDQAKLLQALKADGYHGYLAFEYEGVLDHAEETVNGIKYIKRLLESLY